MDIEKIINLIVNDLQLNAMPYENYVYEPKSTHQIIRKHLTKINQALNIPDVVGQSEQNHCELYDFGRREKPCEKQCEGCFWMESICV